MTTPGRPGALHVFGKSSERPDRLSADEKQHYPYAHHLTNEIEVEEVIKGTLKRFWKPKSDNTHWLDASYYSDVAAAMKGIRIGSASTIQLTKATAERRPTLTAMAGQ
jgi:hypothetical protein